MDEIKAANAKLREVQANLEQIRVWLNPNKVINWGMIENAAGLMDAIQNREILLRKMLRGHSVIIGLSKTLLDKEEALKALKLALLPLREHPSDENLDLLKMLEEREDLYYDQMKVLQVELERTETQLRDQAVRL